MQYEIKAYRAPEGVTVLHIAAADLADAKRQAESKGYRVIAARQQQTFALSLQRRQRFSVALFSQELLSLLDAGLNLVETVDLLARKARDPYSQQVLDSLCRHLREGRSFSRALGAMPEAFPSLYRSMSR